MRDWELLQSLASELISLNIQNHSSNEADKAAHVLSAPIASAYRILNRKATILDQNMKYLA
jgi:hypothetical protein